MSDTHKQVRRITSRQEAATAERFGGRTQPGSGSNWARRHDSRTATELVENKTVVKAGKKQITIKLDALRSVERVALREGRIPVLQFELSGRRYVILTEEDYLEGQLHEPTNPDRQ